MFPLLAAHASSPLQELSPIVPEFSQQALAPEHEPAAFTDGAASSDATPITTMTAARTMATT